MGSKKPEDYLKNLRFKNSNDSKKYKKLLKEYKEILQKYIQFLRTRKHTKDKLITKYLKIAIRKGEIPIIHFENDEFKKYSKNLNKLLID